MKSIWMLRPQKGGDVVIGPFIEKATLEAILSEFGRLAIEAGELLDAFFPKYWRTANPALEAFREGRDRWVAEFYRSNMEFDGDVTQG